MLSACEQVEINPSWNVIDDVTSSGCVSLLHDDGSLQDIHWGKTKRYSNNQYNVVVDVPGITLPVLQLLWLFGVIDGEPIELPPSCELVPVTE